MKFRRGYPERPHPASPVPHLVERAPLCSNDRVELVWNDDFYVCPDCGAAFKGDEDGPGTPYPEWSGEDYDSLCQYTFPLPGWAGEDQMDRIRCALDNGHEGEHVSRKSADLSSGDA